MEISFAYLRQILQEVNDLRSSMKYQPLDARDYDEITYISNQNDTRIGVQQGLRQQLACQKHGFREKSSIRKGSKYYCKIYKKDGRTVCVEKYSKGRIDVVFLAYYKDDRRFLFPFSAEGGFYPTYTYVTHYRNGKADEEYCAERLQIVYERYCYQDDGTVLYDYINYVPEGTVPVLSRASGFFRCTPEIQYFAEDYTTWKDHAETGQAQT